MFTHSMKIKVQTLISIGSFKEINSCPTAKHLKILTCSIDGNLRRVSIPTNLNVSKLICVNFIKVVILIWIFLISIR